MAIWIDDSILLLRLSLLGEHGKLGNISNSEEKENRGRGEARGGGGRGEPRRAEEEEEASAMGSAFSKKSR